MWMKPQNRILSVNWKKKRDFEFRMCIRLEHTPRLIETQEGGLSLSLIYPSLMRQSLSQARMMQPKRNGLVWRLCHNWLLTMLTSC